MAGGGVGKALRSVRFEVFGKVQGVFFRKYTRDNSLKWNLVGWVKNTDKGTVVGTVQGKHGDIQTMKQWLQMMGSPKSRIDRCVFSEEKDITKLDYNDFTIVREDTGVPRKTGGKSGKPSTAKKVLSHPTGKHPATRK